MDNTIEIVKHVSRGAMVHRGWSWQNMTIFLPTTPYFTKVTNVYWAYAD